MSQPNASVSPVNRNQVRFRVSIRGTRPLLQHQFGPESIPLEDQERTGKAGNDPEEWKKSKMVTKTGQLYIRGDYVFSCIRNGGRHIKKGRGSMMFNIESTLQVEDNVVLLNRWMPKDGDPEMNDYDSEVYIDVRGVRNTNSKSRNIRYRLAASAGWEMTFTLRWDKTVVQRETMRSALYKAGVLNGIADGLRIGMGRFEVTEWTQIEGDVSTEGDADAEEETSEGTLEPQETNGVGKGRKKVREARSERETQTSLVE